MSEYPKLLYRDGDLSQDFVTAETPEQEAQGNADGFFFHVTHREIAVDVQDTHEVEETAPQEIAPGGPYASMTRDELRAEYASRMGAPAPGRMSDDTLRAALAEMDAEAQAGHDAAADPAPEADADA